VRIAIYAGSFDPITRGHEDLVTRSLEFVDKLIVAVATNVSKQPLFTASEPVYDKALASGLAMQDTAAVCAVLEKMAGVKRGRKARKKR